MLLLESTGGVLCGSQVKSGLVNSNQKQVLVSFPGVLSKVHTRGRPWEVERVLPTSTVTGVISGPDMYSDSAGGYLGCAFLGGASVTSSSLKATWPHKMDAEAAVLWNSLAKLPTNS